jgi:uncharacterized membrane protein YjjP (DUF1212 family)
MEAKQVLEIVLYAGQMLLANGGEAYRVEETITRICNSYGLECECLTMSTGIFISVIDGNSEKTTSLKRIKSRRVDLYRIELINAFSREIQVNPIPYEEAKKRLKEIDDAPYFSFKVRLFAASMTSFTYALFFKGTIYDAVVSAIVSLGIYYMLEKTSKLGFFQIFEFFFSGLMIGITSLISQGLFPAVDKNNVIIGAIMILIPGVALTNGIKDILYGDFISGIAKFGESMLIIIAIGAGIASALALGMGVSLW